MRKGLTQKQLKTLRRKKALTRKRVRQLQKTRVLEEEKQKRTANKFQNILGLVAASGVDPSVLSKAASISKATRSNFLTQSLLQKRSLYRQLSQAIKTQNCEEFDRLILHFKDIGKDDELFPENNQTLLEILLDVLAIECQNIFITHMISLSNNEIDCLKHMIHTLLLKGARIRKETVMLLWESNQEIIEYILDNEPGFKEASLEYKDFIRSHLYNLYEISPSNIYQYYSHGLYIFNGFVSSYNPKTGEYWFDYPYNNDISNSNNNNNDHNWN
jgi:hypothetical protein